jgi:hypothetical protein
MLDEILLRIGGSYWDRPARKAESGAVLISAVDRMARRSAATSAALLLTVAPLSAVGIYAMGSVSELWDISPAFPLLHALTIVAGGLAVMKLIADIRWTQLMPTIIADGGGIYDDLCEPDVVPDDDESDGEDADSEEELFAA